MNKKKSAWIQLLISSCIAIILVLVLIVGICINNSVFPFTQSWEIFSFGDSDYSSGSGKVEVSPGALKKIHLDWLDGTVQFIRDDGASVITIDESCDQSLFSGEQVHYRYKDGTLDIQYQKKMSFSLFKRHTNNKNLTVKIPWQLCNKEDLKMETNSVSSRITVQNFDIRQFDANSVSGDIRFDGNVEEINCDTVSGNIVLASHTTPKSVSVDSVSADVELQIPSSSEFKVDRDGISGNFNIEGFEQKDNKDETILIGAGNNHYSFDSVSGNINITATQE